METKAFYKTSEWWMTIASNLGAVLAIAAEMVPSSYAIPMMLVVNGLYAVSRGVAKAGVPPKQG